MQNIPLLIIGVMIIALLRAPTQMLFVTTVSALAAIAASGDARKLLEHVAPNAVTVLAIMTVTQLAVHKMLAGGLGEWLAYQVARVAALGAFKNVPASFLIPLIFIPVTMLTAALFHNLTAILVLAPLAIVVCKRFEIMNPVPLLAAMLVSSNLGGASSAFGDTPAILQRQLWGFTPATFSASMLPRNLVIMIVLAVIASWLTVRSSRIGIPKVQEALSRIRIQNELLDRKTLAVYDRGQGTIGAVALAVFVVCQFFPVGGLQVAAIILLPLVIFTPNEKRVDALLALGLEPTLVILSIFVVAGSAEATPLVSGIVQSVRDHHGVGAIEGIAYLLTAAISADGAAATLAPAVHAASEGTMLSAWQLAGGICAGSSVLASSASAGPVLCLVAEQNGCRQFSFRSYAKFGIPFSILMVLSYMGMNALEAKSKPATAESVVLRSAQK